jgi:hypothetical protein
VGDQRVLGQQAEPARLQRQHSRGAVALVIKAASASPIVGDEENPDPLLPLGTQAAGRPGTAAWLVTAQQA